MTHRIDHLVIAVDDLDTSAQSFEDAGFLVTPIAHHPFGTSNRLVVLETVYLELVGVTRPSLIPDAGFAAKVANRLRSGAGGLTHVVLRTDDPSRTAELFAGELFEFSRPAPAIDGSVQTASFTLVMLPDSDPGLFFCTHHNPGSVWHPSHLAHPNGATQLTNVTIRRGRPGIFPEEGVSGVEFGATVDSIVTDGAYRAFDVEAIAFSASGAAP